MEGTVRSQEIQAILGILQRMTGDLGLFPFEISDVRMYGVMRQKAVVAQVDLETR
jgi:hypothetical protein